MINIVQRKATAGAVNLVSDFDDIAINGMKNLSATLKALIFGFHEDKTSGTAVLQGLRVSIDSNAKKISVSSGVAVTKVGVYPFFVNTTAEKELTPEEMNGIGEDGKYLVLRPEVKTSDIQEKRLVKTPQGTYEEQPVYSEQSLQYTIELVNTPQNNDLTFGKIDSNLNYTEDDDYPILRLSRTLDGVTDFLDTATNNANKDSLMLRDENGRAKIANPSANDDIANKVYVDNCINTEKTARENADLTLQSNIDKEISARQAHEARQDNPHAVTKAQVGLGNCDNTADKDKQVATATKLATARTINIQDSSSTNTGTAASFDGSGNATIKLPVTIKANITGNCSGSSSSCTGNAATATKLATARTINIQDSSSTNTGTAASFDGSGNATIKLPVTIKANITGNCSGSSSSCTGNAATATKATQDGNGNNIANTYATKAVATTSALSSIGKNWNMTGTNGLMPGEDKAFIEALKKTVTIEGHSYKGSDESSYAYYYTAKWGGGSSYYRFFG